MHEVARDPIVIVEDDASMSVALDRILRLGGYRSRAFASAEAFSPVTPPARRLAWWSTSNSTG
jgi:FixJ family two-component response regulator